MEYIKRKIKSDVKTTDDEMTYSLINGVRLSIRWKVSEATTKKPSEDVVVNFTTSETKKLKKLLTDNTINS